MAMNENIRLIEKILGLGLSLMDEDARKERMERVIHGAKAERITIDGQALAALIDECRDALRLLAEGNVTTQPCEKLDCEKLDEVMSMLASIDGKKAVASMEPDALVELVLDYWKSV